MVNVWKVGKWMCKIYVAYGEVSVAAMCYLCNVKMWKMGKNQCER